MLRFQVRSDTPPRLNLLHLNLYQPPPYLQLQVELEAVTSRPTAVDKAMVKASTLQRRFSSTVSVSSGIQDLSP